MTKIPIRTNGVFSSVLSAVLLVTDLGKSAVAAMHRFARRKRMSESGDGFGFAKIRELLGDGDLSDVETNLLEHTGRVDPELAEVLTHSAQSLGSDRDPRDSAYYQQAVEASQTRRVSEVVQASPAAEAAFTTGVTDQQLDASAGRAMLELHSIVAQEGGVVVLGGATNSGKTNVGCCVAETEYRLRPDSKLGSNVTTLDPGPLDLDLAELEEFNAFDKWTRDHRGVHKIGLLDEVSSHMSGYNSDRQGVENYMRQLVRFASKRSVILIFVAHRFPDVHPAIREMPDAVYGACACRRDDRGEPVEYTVTLFDRLVEGTPTDRVAPTISNLPKSRIGYDPDEETDWRFPARS